VDSFLADRISVMADLKATLGQPPAKWYEGLDDSEARQAIIETPTRDMTFHRYFQLSYDQDDSQLPGIEDDEDEIPVEEFEKPPREFSDRELQALFGILSRLPSYGPTERGTPETLLEALAHEGI